MINGGYPETPDSWIERTPEDSLPDLRDCCPVCGTFQDCVCPDDAEDEHELREMRIALLDLHLRRHLVLPVRPLALALGLAQAWYGHHEQQQRHRDA